MDQFWRSTSFWKKNHDDLGRLAIRNSGPFSTEAGVGRRGRWGNGQTDESLRVITSDNQVLGVPKDPNNRHYAEILKQVAEGTLTIKDAE